MTKVQTIQAMVTSGVITQEAANDLIALIGTSTGGKAPANPDKLDESGIVIERYCNLHQSYEPIEDFSEKGTKKECKAGVWRWNFINRAMKTLVDTMMSVDTKLTAKEYNEYKDSYNELKSSRVPGASGYNYDTDKSEYTLATTKADD